MHRTLLVICLAAGLSSCGVSEPPNPEIAALLKQNLKPGTTLNQALEFVNGRRIEHTYGSGNRTLSMIFRNVKDAKAGVSSSFAVDCQFGADSVLTACSELKAYTGP